VSDTIAVPLDFLNAANGGNGRPLCPACNGGRLHPYKVTFNLTGLNPEGNTAAFGGWWGRRIPRRMGGRLCRLRRPNCLGCSGRAVRILDADDAEASVGYPMSDTPEEHVLVREMADGTEFCSCGHVGDEDERHDHLTSLGLHPHDGWDPALYGCEREGCT